MNIAISIYLIELLRNINLFLHIILLIGPIGMFIIGIIYISMLYNDPVHEDPAILLTKNILKKYWVILIVGAISTFIPSQKSMYFMLGSKYLSQSNIPSKETEILSLKMDEYILEIKNTLKVKKE